MNMQVVHNALITTTHATRKPRAERQRRSSWALRAAYKAHQEVIKEREKDIKLIQEYFPGWLPEFEY